MKFKKILCPVDFSDFSSAAVETATSFAKLQKAELILLHVADTGSSHAGGHTAYVTTSDDVQKLKTELDSQPVPNGDGVKVTRVFKEGAAVDTIAKYVDENDIDLVVVGTHGRTGLIRMLLGSVAEGVVRKVKCAVLTIKKASHVLEPVAGTERHILCPLDFSPHSNHALWTAASLAQDTNSVLHLMSVTELPMPYADGVPVFSHYADDIRRDDLALKAVNSPIPNVKVEHQHRLGNPSEEILKYAKERGVDLIVMGTHGRQGIDRLLMGSVAAEIVRKATCPVITVRLPSGEDEV